MRNFPVAFDLKDGERVYVISDRIINNGLSGYRVVPLKGSADPYFQVAGLIQFIPSVRAIAQPPRLTVIQGGAA